MSKHVYSFIFGIIIATSLSFPSLYAMLDQQPHEGKKEQFADRRLFLCAYLSDVIACKKELGFNVFDYTFEARSGDKFPSIEEIKKLYRERHIALPCSRKDYQELLQEEEELYGLRKDEPFFAPIDPAPVLATNYQITKPVAQKNTPEQTVVSNSSLVRINSFHPQGKIMRLAIRRNGRRYVIQINPPLQPVETVSLP